MLVKAPDVTEVEVERKPDFSQARFNRTRSHRRIQTAEEVARLVYRDPDGYLEKLQIPESQHDFVRPILHMVGHRQMPYFSAVADLYGYSYEQLIAKADKITPGIQYEFAKNKLTDNYAQIYIPGLEKPIEFRHRQKRKERIKFAPAMYRVFPGESALLIPHAKENDHVFAMYLEPARMLELRKTLNARITEHIPNAFAYIIFREEEGIFQVTELQSDFYGKIGNRGLREQYKHWSKQLMTMFEWYLNQHGRERASKALWHGRTEQTFENPQDFLAEFERLQQETDRSLLINFPTVGTMKRLWRDWVETREGEEDIHHPGIARELALKLYHHLPQSLDYVLTHVPRYEFPLKNTRNENVIVSNFWSKMLTTDESDESGYLDQISALEPVVDTERSEEWYELLSDLFPPQIFQQARHEGLPVALNTDRRYLLEGEDRSHEISAAFETVPLVPISPLRLYGVTRSMHAVHQDFLSSKDAHPVTELFTPDHTFFTRGTVNGTPLDWWRYENGEDGRWGVQPLHIADQDRHPTFRAVAPEGSEELYPMVTVGAKGGGLRVIRDEDVFGNSDDGMGYRPIHMRSPRREEDIEVEIPSHKFWGGLTYAHGTVEMLHGLALLEMQKKLVPNAPIATAIPLDIGFLSDVPTYKDGETTWHNAIQYGQNQLDEWEPALTDRLVCYRSISPCDVRLSQVVNRVIERTEESRSNLDLAREEIETALRFLYRLHGQDFVMPETGIPINDGRVRIHEIFSFLSEIGELNRPAAERILQRFDNKTLRIMGLVHGAGGHLGGGLSQDVGLGAVGGGATTIRNIDAAFVLHDLDPDLFLPWIHRPDLGTEAVVEHQLARSKMQAMDIVYWRDTRYWLETILQGRALPDEARLCHNQIDNRHNHIPRYAKEAIMVVGIPELKVAPDGKPSIYGMRDLLEEDFDRGDKYKKYYNLGRNYDPRS